MSSTVSWTKIFCMLVACCALLGCSAANDQAPALTNTNQHPAGWLSGHRSAYRQNPDMCRECHGLDLKGGITKVDCFNQGGLVQCHANGHAPRAIIHPVPFKGTVDLNKAHGALAKKDLTVCQDCHGTAGGAGNNPRFNNTYGQLPAGCESSGCHNQNMAHPKPWLTHGSAGNQANACALCHGANFEGSASISAPACNKCHTGLIGVQLPVTGACNSCHGNPPAVGSHAVHVALPEIQQNCRVCHDGGGSGTAAHQVFGNLTVAFLPGYNAKSGAASFNKTSMTCANVKCHGGQTTPAWGGHVAGCQSCHTSGNSQYNSFNSGKHDEHVSEGLACTDCHDTVKLAPGHFSNLSSSVINQAAGNTLKNYLNYTQSSCSPASAPAGNQVGVCHGNKTW